MNKLLAKTLYGLEDVLEEELKDLGAKNISRGRRSVFFEGDLKLIYSANYNLRTAVSVLKQLHSFSINKANDLYIKSLKYPWESVMSVGQTFAVVPVINSSLFSHTAYPALVLKDAIVDRFRKKYDRRPSVDNKMPDIVFNCHISEKQVNISIDSSLIPLFKRGYRVQGSEAPLNEVLAAGILKKSGWNMQSDLLDPMCGSGTIPIEAALMARHIAPGRYRKIFGFMNWPDYDQDLFEIVKSEAESKIIRLPAPVIGRDISARSISIARSNIREALLERDIKVSVANFLESSAGDSEYTLIINPPYGERLDKQDTENLYAGIGERLKHGFAGSEAWLLSSNNDAIKRIGLKPSEKHVLFNGKLEVKLLKFDLYKGSRKSRG